MEWSEVHSQGLHSQGLQFTVCADFKACPTFFDAGATLTVDVLND